MERALVKLNLATPMILVRRILEDLEVLCFLKTL